MYSSYSKKTIMFLMSIKGYGYFLWLTTFCFYFIFTLILIVILFYQKGFYYTLRVFDYFHLILHMYIMRVGGICAWNSGSNVPVKSYSEPVIIGSTIRISTTVCASDTSISALLRHLHNVFLIKTYKKKIYIYM